MSELLKPFGDPSTEARHWLDTLSREELVQMVINYAELIRTIERMEPHLRSLNPYLSHARLVHSILLEHVECW